MCSLQAVGDFHSPVYVENPTKPSAVKTLYEEPKMHNTNVRQTCRHDTYTRAC
jgi:hypothetical protein